jgi:hypothetical protein
VTAKANPVLDPAYVKKTLTTTYRDAHIVWGSATLREALVWRDAARAIMAQAEGCDQAQAIIRQFVEAAETRWPD